MVQIVALPGPFADTSEHRETTVSLGNVVDKLHKDSLADSSATKETNLASLTAGGEQVDDLDTSDMDFMLDGHLRQSWEPLHGWTGACLGMGAGAPLVNQVTDHIDDAAKGLLADGDGDGEALILNNITPENILH